MVQIQMRVTERDIQAAWDSMFDVQGKAHIYDNCCPIAQSYRRRFGKMAHVRDGKIWEVGREEKAVPLPKKAMDFVEAFDAGNPVHPINFTLELPWVEKGQYAN